jgi:hypothetical protein
MKQGLRVIVDENKEDLLKGYKAGLCNKEDIEELLQMAIDDEEYEVAISTKEVLDIINKEK